MYILADFPAYREGVNQPMKEMGAECFRKHFKRWLVKYKLKVYTATQQHDAIQNFTKSK
jgi:hypothetical protein